MRIRLVTLFGILAALLAFVAVPAMAEEKTMTPLDIPRIGDMEAIKSGEPAPAFEAKDLEGKVYSFTPAGPGAKVLVFWSIFCEPCREEMPLVQAMHQKFKDKNLSVVTVALDGNLDENIRQFVKQGKYTFKVLLDEESKDGSLVVAEKFMVPGTPTLYVVNPKGKVTFSKVGRVGEAELEKAIIEALGL